MIPLLAGHAPAATAIVDADRGVTVCYGELCDRVAASALELKSSLAGRLVFQVAANTVDSIVAYLACLEAKIPVALVESAASERLNRLKECYQPAAVILPEGRPVEEGMYRICSIGINQVYAVPDQSHSMAIHPDLALLLTTSGSTGSPKLVRLTQQNIVSNARSIASYLNLDSSERAIQSLPLQYSYGLSLINSHLLAGGSVVLTRHSFMRPEFWNCVNDCECTSFAGVPYMYETLHRLGFEPGRYESLRYMTQAGGALRPDLITAFHRRAESAACRLYVMYGQTEATARISYVPPDSLERKIGSIGVPIPGGKLELAEVQDAEGWELVYSGPNVMMGYAEDAKDLSKGDELHGVLRTGDLAKVDSEGFFCLTGRLKRFAKLCGRRVSLEDVEKQIEYAYPIRCAVIEKGERLLIFTEGAAGVSLGGISKRISEQLSLPPKYVQVQPIDAMPMTASGKKDYRALS